MSMHFPSMDLNSEIMQRFPSLYIRKLVNARNASNNASSCPIYLLYLKSCITFVETFQEIEAIWV